MRWNAGSPGSFPGIGVRASKTGRSVARGPLAGLSGALAALLLVVGCAGDDEVAVSDTVTRVTDTASSSEVTTGEATTGEATTGSTSGQTGTTTTGSTSDTESTTAGTGRTTGRTTGVSVGETEPTATGMTVTGPDTDTEGGGGDCCEPQEGPSCGDRAIAECVCAEDSFCCDEQWDGQCAQLVEALGCGMCEGMMALGCCDAHESPSCDDPEIAECVCAQDAYCCETSWDGQCVEEVELFGCSAECGGGETPCCLPHGSPSCDEPEVAACVCDENPYCCEQMWDEECVAAVDKFGCGMCQMEEPGACCEAHGGLGCADDGVEACVCDIAPGCCDEGWDEVCAGLVEFLGCGVCEPPPPPAACCEAHDEPGCDEPEVEACVCEGAPECCEGPWTDACAEAVELLGCGVCGGMEGECCEIHPEPSCNDDAISACVCAEDSFCCENEWDQACVDGVELYGCGVCGGGDSCCEAHMSPGCVDPEVEACVCAEDPLCCQAGWDDVCVQEVDIFGCGMCG